MENEIAINQSFDKKTLMSVTSNMFLSGRMLLYIAVFVGVVLINIVGDLQEGYSLDIYMFVPFLILIPLIFWIWYRAKIKISKNYEKNPRYYRDVTFTITKDSMTLEGKDFQNKVPWESFHKIKEKDKWFLIYINRHQAHVIDKSQLKEITVEELRDFFRHIPPKTKVSLK